jgi:hypothetical protein
MIVDAEGCRSRCRSRCTLDTFPLRWRREVKANLGVLVAIIQGRVGTFICLRTYLTRFVNWVEVMVAIFTGTRIAPFRVCANGMPVTIIGIAHGTFIFIDTLTFTIALEESGLALARTFDTNRVLAMVAIGVSLARRQWRFRSDSFGGWSPGGGRSATNDSVSSKFVVANANCSVVGRYSTGCVLMAAEIDAHILWKALEWTPFDWHIVRNVARIGENGIITRETTAFEFLWRIVVNTERAFFRPPSTGKWRSLTFIHLTSAVEASIAVRAFNIATEDLILTIANNRDCKS